jgi:hypothetical protein
MLVIAACSNAASQAPALTDPKEILAQTAASLKDVKTVELVGSLTGKVQAAELGGSLDLSSTTIAGAFDIPNQKAKLTIDAPALLSTKVEAIVVDGFAYVKIDGMLAGLAGLPSGKYVKTAVPEASGKPVTNPSEIAQGSRTSRPSSTSCRRRRRSCPTRSAATSTATTSRSRSARPTSRSSAPRRPRRPRAITRSTSGPARATSDRPSSTFR